MPFAAMFRQGLIGELTLAVCGGVSVGIAGAFWLADMDAAHARQPDVQPQTQPEIQVSRPAPDELVRPMRFVALGDGVLLAQGSIEPGTAARLALELQAQGGTVTRVTFNSPGGALEEAMEIGQQLRAAGIATAVADGAICASSCPLAFAGGVARHAGVRAAIGVHQFYAASVAELRGTIAADAMADTQIVTARITRYLKQMNIDPAVWLHALDTPPSALYTFSSFELAEYRLTTEAELVPVMLGRLARYLSEI